VKSKIYDAPRHVVFYTLPLGHIAYVQILFQVTCLSKNGRCIERLCHTTPRRKTNSRDLEPRFQWPVHRYRVGQVLYSKSVSDRTS